jgi:dCMP deaminase
MILSHKSGDTSGCSSPLPNSRGSHLSRRIRTTTILMTTDEYYMGIAIAVREKANCLGRKVGAVLVKENRIISTGYNGTPEGVDNCLEGGCVRCSEKEQFAPSVGYDVCICVHAEENALITAARFGISVDGAIAYSTMRPCFTCTRALFQVKVQGIFYLHDWKHPEADLNEQYEPTAGAVPRKGKTTSPERSTRPMGKQRDKVEGSYA